MRKTNVADLTMFSISEGFKLKEVVGHTGALQTGASSLAYFELDPEGSFDAHFHRHSHEIYLCLSGRAELVVNGQTVLLSGGDVILFEPGDDHAGKAVGDEPFIYWAITTPAYHIDDHIASDGAGRPLATASDV